MTEPSLGQLRREVRSRHTALMAAQAAAKNRRRFWLGLLWSIPLVALLLLVGEYLIFYLIGAMFVGGIAFGALIGVAHYFLTESVDRLLPWNLREDYLLDQAVLLREALQEHIVACCVGTHLHGTVANTSFIFDLETLSAKASYLDSVLHWSFEDESLTIKGSAPQDLVVFPA